MSTNKGRQQLDDVSRYHLAAASGFACAYCQVVFGSIVKRRGHEEEVTRMEVDHVIPVAWTGRAVNEGNLISSCQVCNRLKGDKVFASVGDARRHLDRLWVRDGYVVLFVPTRSNFEDPEGWAKEYARQMRMIGIREDSE